jgi:tRNA-splicing ligase RtcB (3'-phosphate/5'-hydroxy nucleic acid ligase)
VRLLGSGLSLSEIEPQREALVASLFSEVPTGVGATGALKLSAAQERQVMVQGARWAVSQGYGFPEDLDHMEEHGCLAGADPQAVSDKATERGRKQLGTLGSGNHFLEVGFVQEIYDEAVAKAFGLRLNQITVLIHTGSRGFGYQICDDYLKIMAKQGDQIALPDRQLACAYIRSSAAQQYLAAMACAANYAWANRQMITHWTRQVFQQVLGVTPHSLRLMYDVCHNIAKREKHQVDGEERWVCVHRKGATRAFPPYHPHVPEAYRQVGQPVLIPGDMGRCSYVLVGTQRAMEETWGTTCHGAGRVMSRTQARAAVKGRSIERDLLQLGVIVKGQGWASLAEEVPQAYKDVSHVVEVVHRAGIALKVAQLRPLGVIKG